MTAARARGGPAVELDVRDGIAWLTLARPGNGNRCDGALLAALADACETIEGDDGVRVAVVSAQGAAFSLGLPAGRMRPAAEWPDGVAALAAVTKPVVAAIQGDALGWGLGVALACDVRIAARGAVLALPELADGGFPGGGVTPRLVRAVGVARALDLVLLGTRLDAARAVEWGLVREVVAPGRLAAAAAETAGALAARAPVALRFAKEAVVRALDLPLADGIRLEEDLYVLLQTTEDRREGIRAFLAHRKPGFHGR